MSVLSIYEEYKHLKCNCGGIIGMYDREHYSCNDCKKEYENPEYDYLGINEKTGWIFPMVKRN